ncbi:hypothetical protein C1H46_037978 [Malus baccata]|uniref:Uncharacterized protein n=1 Tax=Malus baccata TaxID=106549 RepID=A0A540KQN2_MALBA|nr:hypothetical protein C1H46_037978 [Malus baccata]
MSEIFRSLVLNRRFDDVTLRVLESALVSKDVKSSIEVRSSFRQFMRSESLSVLRETAEKNVEEKLLVLEFLVRAFALSCLALRYEALLLRDIKSSTNPWLQVSYTEWLNFAHQSRDSGFYSVAGKACEHALDCIKMKSTEDRKTDEVNVMKKSTEDPKTDEVLESVQAIEKIKRLKDCAMASASSHSGAIMKCKDMGRWGSRLGLSYVKGSLLSIVTKTNVRCCSVCCSSSIDSYSCLVQAQTADYLKKRLKEKSTERPLDFKEPKCVVASTLFRNGIRRRNLRKLNTSRSLLGMTTES